MPKQLKSLLSETNPLRLLYHRFKSEYIAWKAGYPARKLKIIGITGTDGKTTTVAMLDHILSKNAVSAGSATTAFLAIDGMREQNPTQKTSMPAARMQAFLRRLIREGCTHAILEVSSHGLMQSRFAGIYFDVAAITNIAMEHLDYHKTMEGYMKAKALLFRRLKSTGTKVLNADDRTYLAYKGIRSAQTITYSPSAQLKDIGTTAISVQATATIDGKPYLITLPVTGEFNLSNALCAISCAQAIGIDTAKSIEALSTFQPAAGRMEYISEGQPFSVYIDFTVTPQAFEKTLSTVRQMVGKEKKVIVLTGSCGNRMKEKRPVIGKLCSTLADISVFTDDEPYDEDPQAIIDEICSGVDVPNANVHKILDRREAIRFALLQAQSGDAVILCGLGSYPTRMMKDGPMEWNEQKIVREELKKLH